MLLSHYILLCVYTVHLEKPFYHRYVSNYLAHLPP